MKRIFQGRGKAILTLLMAIGLASFVGHQAVEAAAITNVTVSKGAKHVYVKVQANGGISYTIHHMPPGADDYRNIVVDVSPAYIVPGKEPMSKLSVDEGLVANVRVRPMGGTVRVFVDVIAWPNYQVFSDGSSVTLKIDPYHQRSKNPAAPR